MNKGIVKFFNDQKGYGFIKDENSEKEYFVHSTGLKDRIKENDEVTFDLEQGNKGINAVNVKLA
jgi:cold shock protein